MTFSIDDPIFQVILALLLSFVISAVLIRIFIPVLRKVKLGQKILEIGPAWHKSKEGTPIMGGLFFLTATLVTIGVLWLCGARNNFGLYFLISLAMMLLNAGIGFIDDYIKLFKKRNKGLTASQKLILQLLVAALYLAALRLAGYIDTAIVMPFSGVKFELGIFWYPIVLLIIVYMINCANLTDGIDGLAGSVAVVIAVMFTVLGCAIGFSSLSVSAAALTGALLGFLVFNFHPAKIFMGDTGSLFLGAAAVAFAMMAGNILLLLLFGLIYLIEGISVILQVVYFKLTKGKRLFKMAPIHHHLEMCGWSEVKIVFVFSLLTAVVCAAAYYGYAY